MVLSCTTCSLRGRGRDEIEETFRYAPEAGFEAWGLGGPFTWEPGLIRWLDVEKLRAEMIDAGLPTLTEVWTPPIPTDSPEAVREGVGHVVLAAHASAALGCDCLVQTGGPRRESGLALTIAGLEELDRELGDLGVRVALEPHVGSQILDDDDYARLMAELPATRFGITVDTGHFHTAGVDWKAMIRRYPDRIYNVHVKDHIGAQSVAIGEGEIDLRGLIDGPREGTYDRPLAIEMEVDDPENQACVVGCRDVEVMSPHGRFAEARDVVTLGWSNSYYVSGTMSHWPAGGHYTRGYCGELEHFVRAVLGIVDPQSTLADGVEAMRIIDGILRSVEEGCEIRMADITD